MLLPLAEIPVNVIPSDQPVRSGRRRSSGQPLHPRNPNIALSCADLERHDSLLFDSATEDDYNLWSSEEEDQLVFPHHSHLRSSIYDAERVVANEMDGHAYGNTEGLIDTFLGDSAPLINKITDRIYRALVKSKDYDPNKQVWKHLPISPRNETVLYSPLTKLLNQILVLCEEALYEVHWRDEHASPPKSDFQDQSRPDLISTTIAALLWWRAIHSLIEVKKDVDDSAALQLLRYIRSTLREQPDRRFMYGLVFARRALTLWQVDRSGSLAAPPFDIHKDAKQFIRIVVGLLVKSPESLGWDPTMLRFIIDDDHPHGHSLPSYQVHDAHIPSSPYTRMWLVTVDAPSASPNPQTGASDAAVGTRDRSDPPQERFILYKALSLARAEVLRGRATRIWLAWRLEDIEKEQKDRKVYVFKDAWRDERRGLEGDLYREGPGVAKVYSYNVVRIKGRRDDTLNFIRRGLKPSENDALLLTTDQREAKKILADHPLKRDQYLLPSISHGDIPYEGDILKKAKSTGGPHNRIHTRLIMETYGLPLTRFRSLGEMIGVLRDAIQGHQFLTKESILHRDISQGNILIIPDSSERGYHGVLIDLDFAINLKERTRATIGDERSGTRAFMSGEILTGKPYSFPPPQSKNVRFTADDDDMMEPMPTTGRTVKHDAVHDLESFFWVLCWLGVSYEGPATRRTHAWPEDEVIRQDLKDSVKATFESLDGATLARQKGHLLVHENPASSEMSSWFPPYFRPALRLVAALHDILKEAYSKRNFTSVHEDFLTQFTFAESMRVLPTWHDTDENYRIQEEAEVEMRQRELNGPYTDEVSFIEVWKSNEEIQADIDRSRASASRKRGNVTPVKHAGPSSGSGQTRAVRFDAAATEDTVVPSDNSPSRKASKRRRGADDDTVEDDGTHASPSTSVTGESSSRGPRRSTRSKTKVDRDTRTTASGSRSARGTKPPSKKRARR